METCRINGDIYEIIKQTDKTTQVKIISGYDKSIRRVKNEFVTDDPIIPLTVENCQKVAKILNIKNVAGGIKTFTFDSSKDKFHSHTNGQAVLFEENFKHWRVIEFKG